MLPDFVHLRLHSEYSITDGVVRIDKAVSRARDDGQPALALTDLGNAFGLVKFYQAARKAGVKPLLGADIWVGDPQEPDDASRLLLLCRNNDGYRQLCELLSRGALVQGRRERVVLDPVWFDEVGCEGLIALSGAAEGDVGKAILQGRLDEATLIATAWKKRFGSGYYLEVQRYGHPDEETLVTQTALLSLDVDVPLVATHPVQFLDRDDFRAHDARVCIATGYTLADKRRLRVFTEQQYFQTRADMAERFSDLPQALTNSFEVARRCNVTLTLGKSFLPDFPTPNGEGLDEFLVAEARRGLVLRLQQLYSDEAVRAARQAEYDDRLDFECQTIIQMGFPGYFLIVADFINWAKNNGVPVGPGRGSGAGSLVAYSLGITDLDPLAYALLFERFLNPERVSMPDFDIDFCQDNRWKVIEYVREKYGADAVSQIATFGTMSSKAVIRDVGRVLDLPYNFCDQLSKLIPVVQNRPVSLAEALSAEPQLQERYEREEEVKELFTLANKLEDLTRNVGMHAGGVLIAPGKLTDFCPLYTQPGGDSVVSQYDKDDVEKVGLVKFDFLGLRNLTIIELALDYVARLTGKRPDLNALAFDDPKAYQILKDANTTAIFQVESEGMKKLLKKLAPDRFEDIVAVLALYRPGPLGSGMVDDFILRKKGLQKIDYFHESLKACLTPTYGVIVYQEQVMQISQLIGRYTLGAADMLRRAMGKKKPEEMAEYRDIFREGAKQNEIDERLAMQLFDLMEKFAEYGFNKSHTAAYAVVTYHTAWLKAHHAAAFMAATLSSDMDNTDTVKIFHDDAKANGLTILGPDVNHSEFRFAPVDAKTIRYGLGAVKGTGENAVNAIIAARTSGGPFKDIFDFCQRVDRRVVNRRAMEALVRAGAFDALDAERSRVLSQVSLAVETAEQTAANAHQNSLFGMDDLSAPQSPPDAGGNDAQNYPRWTDRQRLIEEKAALGFFFSAHPFDIVRAEVRPMCQTPIGRLEAGRDATLVAGIVTDVRTQMTRRGKMAFVTLDDGNGRIEAAVFSELFDAQRHKLRMDELLLVEGKVSRDEFRDALKLGVDRLMTFNEARAQWAQGLELDLRGIDIRTLGGVRRLYDLLQPFAQLTESATGGRGCPVSLRYSNGTAEAVLEVGNGLRVRPDTDLIDGLRSLLGSDRVRLDYQLGAQQRVR
ncbi:MAG: DNA polymerase III alpha subunit [Fluviibacter phosphoraccumulans EoVTN8]